MGIPPVGFGVLNPASEGPPGEWPGMSTHDPPTAGILLKVGVQEREER